MRRRLVLEDDWYDEPECMKCEWFDPGEKGTPWGYWGATPDYPPCCEKVGDTYKDEWGDEVKWTDASFQYVLEGGACRWVEEEE